MNEPHASIDRDLERSREWSGRQTTERHGRTAGRAGADHRGGFQVERAAILVIRTLGGSVEEDIEGTHPRRPIGRIHATADRDEGHRVDSLENRQRATPLCLCDSQALDQRPSRAKIDDQAAVLRLRGIERPVDDQRFTLLANADATIAAIVFEIDAHGASRLRRQRNGQRKRDNEGSWSHCGGPGENGETNRRGERYRMVPGTSLEPRSAEARPPGSAGLPLGLRRRFSWTSFRRSSPGRSVRRRRPGT